MWNPQRGSGFLGLLTPANPCALTWVGRGLPQAPSEAEVTRPR